MLVPVSYKLRKIASEVLADYPSESPYINWPTLYFERNDPTETSQEVQLGPPSMYDEPDNRDDPNNEGREKNKKDMRRQGPRPSPVDPLTRIVVPVVTTTIGSPRENAMGEKCNDTTLPGARNENRDTIGFDPDTLTGNPFEGW